MLRGGVPVVELRTVIFVDGQNLRNNLRAFRFWTEESERVGHAYRLEEGHFYWAAFFNGVLDKFDESTGYNHRLLRVYWYNAETITPFRYYKAGIKKIVEQHNKDVPGLTDDMVLQATKTWHEQEAQRFRRFREDIYEKIQRATDFLEFKYIGFFFVDAYKPSRLWKCDDGSLGYWGTRVGEKGVDTGMAVDMVSKMKDYDVAILVSGDADFFPVVKYLKDNLKQVYQFSLALGVPPEIKYLSPWLKSIVDVFAFFDEVELLSKYLDGKFPFPPDVMKAIESRIADLKG